MFSKIIFSFVLFASLLASAKTLTAQDLRERFEIRADVYILDESGQKLMSGPERTNYWRMNPEKGKIDADWSSKFTYGNAHINFKCQIEDDSNIKISVTEFDRENDESNKTTPPVVLENKSFTLKNFEPVVWKIHNIKDKNMIVRFVPALREVATPVSVDSLPVAGTGISVSDNMGYLWAEGLDFNGKYVGMVTHRGTLILSYVPFDGAKEMGFVEGNQLTLNVNKKFQVNLKSATSFLPAGVIAKVFAYYNPDKKSNGFNSIHSYDTNKESRIKEILQK
jgi:hypothetical protein